MELTNFRDLGGLLGFEGKKIKEKSLLRAGQPVNLVDSDLIKLKDEYKLAHIIDFRSIEEVGEKPVDIIEGVDYLNIAISSTYLKDQQKVSKAPSFDGMLQNLKPGQAEMFMSEMYVELVVSEDALVGYRKFIDVLLNSKGTLLFHCFAGKDRTGWGAVILLKILGVSDEDIMSDYLATIEGRQVENAKMIEKLREGGLTEEQLASFEEMMTVKSGYLDVAFNTVSKEYGTFDNYFKKALNVADEEIAKLRDLYLI